MKEYGGYLPLEINCIKEYYSQDEYPVLKVNSGRAAVYFALKIILPRCVYVPYYICNTVCEVIEKLNIPMKRYHISEDFIPQLDVDSINTNDCILIVNYFGLLDSYIQKFADLHENLIIDNTQAFFSKPIIKKGIYNVYSYRKFVGVSDGGYLIAEDITKNTFQLHSDYSSEFAGYLLVSYEKGTNVAYHDNIKNEIRLKDNICAMSHLTSAILSSTNYKKIYERRENNWKYLQKRLGSINLLSNLTQKNIPGYVYPLLVEQDIRSELIKEKIYVSCLWKELLERKFYGTREYYFSKYLIPLPIDQRYECDDMEQICNIVLDKLGYC